MHIWITSITKELRATLIIPNVIGTSKVNSWFRYKAVLFKKVNIIMLFGDTFSFFGSSMETLTHKAHRNNTSDSYVVYFIYILHVAYMYSSLNLSVRHMDRAINLPLLGMCVHVHWLLNHAKTDFGVNTGRHK